MCLTAWTAPCLNPGLGRRLVCSKSKLRLTIKWLNVLINPLFLQKLFLHNLDYPYFKRTSLQDVKMPTLKTAFLRVCIGSGLRFSLGQVRGQFSVTKHGGSATSGKCLKLKLMRNRPKNLKPCCSPTAIMLRAGKLFCSTNSIFEELSCNTPE